MGLIYHGDPEVTRRHFDGVARAIYVGDSTTDGGDADGGLERAFVRGDPFYFSGGLGNVGSNMFAPGSLPAPTGCSRGTSTRTIALNPSPWTGNSHVGPYSGLTALHHRQWVETQFDVGTNNISGDSNTGFSQRIWDSLFQGFSAANIEAEQMWQGKRFGENATLKCRIIYYAHAGAPQNLRVWRYSTAASSSNTTWSMATSGGIVASEWFTFPAWTSFAESSSYPRFTITTGSATRSGAGEVAVIIGIEWSIDDVGIRRNFIANGGWWPDTYLDEQICTRANLASLLNVLEIEDATHFLGVNGLSGGGRTPQITAAKIVEVMDMLEEAKPGIYHRLITCWPLVGQESAQQELSNELIAVVRNRPRAALCDMFAVAGDSKMVAARFLADGTHLAYVTGATPRIGTDQAAQWINQCMQQGRLLQPASNLRAGVDRGDGTVGTALPLRRLRNRLG